MNGTLVVNGAELNVTFGPTDSLLHVLRNHGHTEVKRGCSSGECGSCIIMLEGKIVNSCQVFAAKALGKNIVTASGISDDGEAHTIHEAFVDAGAVQCGYCTPGMVMATKALLDSNPSPSEDEIKEGLVGNLCRCTGYVKIIDGVRLAAQRMVTNG